MVRQKTRLFDFFGFWRLSGLQETRNLTSHRLHWIAGGGFGHPVGEAGHRPGQQKARAGLPEATHGDKRAGVYSGKNLRFAVLLGLCGSHNHQMTFSIQETISEMHWAKQVQAQ